VNGDVIEMSAKERDRLAMMRRAVAGELTQVRAGELLKRSARQVKRLVAAFRRRGDRGLVLGKRGKPSNNRLDRSVVGRIETALRDRYADFGATFAAETLSQHEGLSVSKETVRQLQTRLGLHVPRARRKKRVFQLRERRPHFGELIQIDSSVHDWLEGRGPKMTPIVLVVAEHTFGMTTMPRAT
jgi:transposase